jgi:polysaccharide export outer membrane protein
LNSVQRYVSGCLAVFCAILLSACQSGGAAAVNNSYLAVPDTTSPIERGDVRIGSLDLLDIAVFGAPNLNGAYQVDFEGSLKMPLIGTFRVVGYTASELASYIEGRLGERYLQKPDVTVRISKAQEKLITVDGSVAKPGLYPVQGPLTLLQVIALSGGPTENANIGRVIVFRQIEGKRSAAGFDLGAIREGKADDPLVYGNDIIVVDGSEAKRRYGDLLRSLPLLSLFMIY